MIAALPCYIAADATGTCHMGSSVFEVAKSAGLAWDWNESALRSLALFGHTIGRDTLHPNVFRTPNDAIVEFSDAGSSERSLESWSTPAKVPVPVNEAVRALQRALERDATGVEVLLSLSAGYDSRLLLALCLASGVRPRCVTMGPQGGTDVEVAGAICKKYDLEHERIELRPEYYLPEGPTITRLTSGTKLAGNWHTYLYARAATRANDEIHLVGSNGEFARNFYLPEKRLSPALLRAPSASFPIYWLARMRRRRALFRGLPLIESLRRSDSWSIAKDIPNLGGGLPRALDMFYATQRVRHFIGNGLALYSAVGKPRAPFLDAEVLSSVRGLDASKRRHNAFHLEAIASLAPSLLDFPFNAPISGKRHVGYTVFPRVLEMAQTRDVILDAVGLDPILSRLRREALVREANPSVVEWMLTLAFAATAASTTEPSTVVC